jgi:type I restriction enzyme S subunit
MSARFALPSTRVLRAFELRVAPMFERVLAASEESRTLAALRDTLLPKLVSGEPRVKDAEHFFERTL